MLSRARRAVRLGYLVGRAVVHTFVSPTAVSTYCKECNSMMVDDGPGRGPRIVYGRSIVGNRAPGRECPVHVAWRELLRGGQ